MQLSGRLKRWCGTYGFIEAKDGFDYFFCKSNIATHQRELHFRPGQGLVFTVNKVPDPGAEDSAARYGKAGVVTAV
ncbi:hypothetical protein [Endozoicomonas sp. Mp262]|uniref:hypothetical protein n=1 Tax=Endozoicomonas sp. Mp262 TaxID=2919499 RepID=UPI0021D8D756